MNATSLTLCFGFVLSCFLLGCVLIYPDLMDPAGMRIGVKKDISLFSLFLHVDFHLTLFLVFMTFFYHLFYFLFWISSNLGGFGCAGMAHFP